MHPIFVLLFSTVDFTTPTLIALHESASAQSTSKLCTLTAHICVELMQCSGLGWTSTTGLWWSGQDMTLPILHICRDCSLRNNSTSPVPLQTLEVSYDSGEQAYHPPNLFDLSILSRRLDAKKHEVLRTPPSNLYGNSFSSHILHLSHTSLAVGSLSLLSPFMQTRPSPIHQVSRTSPQGVLSKWESLDQVKIYAFSILIKLLPYQVPEQKYGSPPWRRLGAQDVNSQHPDHLYSLVSTP